MNLHDRDKPKSEEKRERSLPPSGLRLPMPPVRPPKDSPASSPAPKKPADKQGC